MAPGVAHEFVQHVTDTRQMDVRGTYRARLIFFDGLGGLIGARAISIARLAALNA
jgi:hypothetical protein